MRVLGHNYQFLMHLFLILELLNHRRNLLVGQFGKGVVLDNGLELGEVLLKIIAGFVLL
jgi:hypothetical protein